MAFTVSVEKTASTQGRAYIVYTITETSIGAASEWEIDVPKVGTITLFEAELTSGTGTTVQPELGNVSGWTDDTIAEIDVVDTAAARHNVQTFSSFAAPTGKLYGRSSPDAGSDNAVTTRITIMAGHQR